MMVPIKFIPYFQQGAIQQRATPNLPDMSLNLTSERKIKTPDDPLFPCLKTSSTHETALKFIFSSSVPPNPPFDSLRMSCRGLTKRGTFHTVKESTLFFIENVLTEVTTSPLYLFGRDASQFCPDIQTQQLTGREIK